MSFSNETYWAPGKLLLFGEHSAVYGYPAVGTTMGRGLRIAVSPAERMTLAIEGEARGVESEESAAEHALGRFASFLSDHAPHLPPSRVRITSDLPLSSGFGSSAALCTALAQWSLAAETPGTGGEPAREQVWRRAHELETFFHGTPSGIDTGLAALGGVQAFHFDARRDGGLPSATRLPGELPPLVVGSIPRTRSTRELVTMVRRRREDAPAATDGMLKNLGSIADDAIRRLSTPRATPMVLGELARAAQEHLSHLGVSSEAVERVLRVGSSAGALGGKVSGAGGGGAFYLVCADSDAAAAIRIAVSRELPTGSVAFVL